MPTKKNGSTNPSDENGQSGQSNGRNSPAYPYEADENLQKNFEGYDEDRTSQDPRYKADFDVDENEVNQRKDQYKNVNDQMNTPDRSNTEDKSRKKK